VLTPSASSRLVGSISEAEVGQEDEDDVDEEESSDEEEARARAAAKEPPATAEVKVRPKFRKYCVDDFSFLKVLGKGR